MRPIVILGPTAVGKTETAIRVAERLNGEIISADTIQIYRHMDIGSAKPSPDQLKRVKHHLIDIKNPDETFSSGAFVQKVKKLIEEISQRDKLPIIVGGGGFYVDSLIFGLDEIPPVSDRIKRFFDDICEEFGAQYLYNLLKITDDKWASRINPTDCQRIKRALSVFIQTGKPITDFFKPKKRNEDFFIVVLHTEKEKLNKRIEKRVDRMIEAGLVDEVKKLIQMGYAETNALKAIGYKEIAEYLAGRIPLTEAIDLIKKNTKAYAKRQITLLRSRFSDALWIDVDKQDAVEAILAAYKPSL